LVCPGAEYGPAKQWLPERYAEVIQQAANNGIECILVGTAKDRPVAENIRHRVGMLPVQNLAGKTSLQELIELLRNCDLLLTNDTGTMHLATLLGTPTISIFGSTEPARTGPLGLHHTVFRHQVECSPCFLRECPIDFRCMRGVSSAEVAAAVLARCKGRGSTPTTTGS
jgi:lipopolysaccharide heptosyltransferase II